MLALIENDVYLKPFERQLTQRNEWYNATLKHITYHFGSLEKFASAHHYFGFNYDEKEKGYFFREWLPNAQNVSLIGEFNNWNHTENQLRKLEFGVWEVFLPDDKYATKLLPFSKIKLQITTPIGNTIYKIPAYIQRVIQNEDHSFDGQFIPKSSFRWSDDKFSLKNHKTPFIYECHIGMATEQYKVGTYNEFTEKILPKIKELGYNTIQLMAIQEHPYYGSFGYQVSNFFAPSSRFGTPDALRNLINTAHQMDIAVILDVVHSHAVKNELEGLANFDGTDLYFNGNHPDWDSKLFNYGKEEVKRFLLSNINYWMEEFHFDGFRFDGVTSMLYHHFGHINFDNYSKYFADTNNDAIIYLQLANTLIHNKSKKKLSICEDMSGMPGACRPIEEGGLGFDFRLAMGIPDFWMDLLEHVQDEHWHIGNMYWRLTDRRKNEKTIAYAESHDQALVGDKTIAFWLMDANMYTGMSVFTEDLRIDRGIALHKMIRFVTISLGGEGYMNFMGNEFGHPEWVDFPREGNNWNYQYARRQWSLPETDHLKYKYLNAFDKEMIQFISKNKINEENHYATMLHEDNENKILIFKKRECIFIFNFGLHSIEDYRFFPQSRISYKVVFSSDDEVFGGYNRIDKSLKYKTQSDGKISIYIPSRMCMVLK